MEGPWSFLPVFPRPAVVQGVKERQTQDEEGHIEHKHGVDEVPGVHLPGGDKEEGDPKDHAQEGQGGEAAEQVVKQGGEPGPGGDVHEPGEEFLSGGLADVGLHIPEGLPGGGLL